MDVINLMDDDAPRVEDNTFSAAGRHVKAEVVRITSREGRKAANRITNDYPTYDEVIVSSVVQTFCMENPDIKDVALITQRCLTRLDPSQLMPEAHSTASDQSSKHNSSGKLEVIDSIDADDDFEEVCLVSKSTPLVEVLRLFPNAKKNEVNSLLEKFGFEVHSVVQHMLDKGYEKEEPEDSQEEKHEEKAAIKHDFTSNTWETSAEYRKDAVNELQRNFPFLTQPSLAGYFKKEQHHFYHTVMGIEKRLKINALFLSPSKVQKLSEVLSGEGAASSTSPASAVKIVPAPVKKESAVIDLFDSQSDTYNLNVSSSAGATVIDLDSSSSKAFVKPKSNSARAMLSAFNSRYLTAKQVAELRARCDKATTGLTVKSGSIDCVYTSSTSCVEDSSLSYLMQPLDSVLQAEIEFMTEHRLKEQMLLDQQAAEALNEQIATEDGSLMECGCCYGEYAFEALVQCSEGHLFCKQCLQRYCEQTVFGNGRSSLKCMCTAEVCEGFFSDSMLRHCLPDKVFEKFSQALSRDALTAAKMEGMVSCYHCSMQMQMEEDAGNVIHCPYCRHQTCRLCNEKSHVPLRCSEVEKKSDTSARLSVEEAMTQARLRECKKCKTKFFKVEGCNKMTCRCGANICYVCREDISKVSYAHFCQTAHCDHSKCKKCKLYSDSLEDDRIAMKEAGLHTLMEEQSKLAAEKEGKAGGGANTTTADGINKTGVVGLDLDKLLEGGGKLKPPTAAALAQARAIVAQPFPGAAPVAAAAVAAVRHRPAQVHRHGHGHAEALRAHNAAVAAAAGAGAAAGGFNFAGGNMFADIYGAVGGYFGMPAPPAPSAANQAVAAAQAAAQAAVQAAAQATAQAAAQAAHAARITALQARAAQDQQRAQMQIERQQFAAARVTQAQQRQALAEAARQRKDEAAAARRVAKAAADERRRQSQVAVAEAIAIAGAKAQRAVVVAAAVPAPVVPAPVFTSPTTRSPRLETKVYVKKENKRVKTE